MYCPLKKWHSKILCSAAKEMVHRQEHLLWENEDIHEFGSSAWPCLKPKFWEWRPADSRQPGGWFALLKMGSFSISERPCLQCYYHKFSKRKTGLEKLAQCLRALTVLTEDTDSVPSIKGLTITSNTNSRGPDALFQPFHKHLHSHCKHKLMQAAHTCTLKLPSPQIHLSKRKDLEVGGSTWTWHLAYARHTLYHVDLLCCPGKLWICDPPALDSQAMEIKGLNHQVPPEKPFKS